jgi:hypothetical protein
MIARPTQLTGVIVGTEETADSVISNPWSKKRRGLAPGRRMRWSDVDISFRPEDHPDVELTDRNLPFIIKIPIGCHKVAKTLINNRASLNLMMRKTFIEMGLNLAI